MEPNQTTPNLPNPPQAPVPGSLSFNPTGPETGLPIESIIPEKDFEQKSEKKETLPIPTYPDTSAEKPAQQTVTLPTIKPTPAKVVDKTKEITRLKHIANPHDKLTSLADAEEEEFIGKVESAHGHK